MERFMHTNPDQIAAAGRFIRLSRVLLVLAPLTWVLSVSATAFAAGAVAGQPCPNEQVRIDEPFGLALPDCRAYEQVSPAEKNLADALGAITTVRSASSGEAMAYDSLGPFALTGGAQEGSSQLFNTYLSLREGEGWPTTKLDPPVSPGGSAQPLALSEDLRYAFERSDDQPPLTPEGVEGHEAVYLRDNATGTERLLFGLAAGEKASFFLVADAAEDSRVFFESANDLSEKAAPGTRNLYEWHEGKLSLVNLLPGGSAPTAGAGAGQRGPGAVQESVELPDHSFGSVSYFAQNAVSRDGSEIYFTDLGTGLLYVRHQQPGGEGETVAVSTQPVAWQAASTDGSHRPLHPGRRALPLRGLRQHRADPGRRRSARCTGDLRRRLLRLLRRARRTQHRGAGRRSEHLPLTRRRALAHHHRRRSRRLDRAHAAVCLRRTVRPRRRRPQRPGERRRAHADVHLQGAAHRLRQPRQRSLLQRRRRRSPL